MENPRILSGEALVAKGITKIDATLPEVGLKDVIPNGSWLEQKQIQAALEARKYLMEVERIEKCGTLSHAEWRDGLMLAEVTQKAGSYWQYLGHNVGKTLYLRPEEALFLMEVNCLLLKHNEVTVSLQKAYSLLLNSSTTLLQYKVYASLSRLGYRVFRHTGPKVNDEKKSNDQKVYPVELNADPSTISKDEELKHVDSPKSPSNTSECVESLIVSKEKESETIDLSIDSTLNNSENIASPIEVNESENADSSVVKIAVEAEKTESDEPTDNTSSLDSKSVNSLIVDTVPDSRIVENPRDDDNVETSGNHESPIESQANKLSENEQEQGNDQKVKGSETNGNILELDEVKNSEAITEQFDAENSVTKENESPNIMEVDDIVLKTTDNKMDVETIQEVSSTIIEISKNVEHEVENMEICNGNQEAIDSILIEESDDKSKNLEVISAEEPNAIIISDVPIDLVEVVDACEDAGSATSSEIERKETGTQTIEDSTKCLEVVPNNNDPSDSRTCTTTENITQKVHCTSYNDSYNYLSKIERLTKRQLKPIDSETMEKYFENIPDFSKDRIVTVNVPEQQFIPKNIFVNKAAYTLNLQTIKMRSVRSASSESPAYTSSDEVNGTNIRRIRSSSEVLGIEFPQNPNFFPQGRFPRFHQNFRPYGFWRPQNNLNFYQLMFFQTRIQYHQRPHPSIRSSCFSINPNNHNISNNARKRTRSGKSAHFQGIKNLAVRLKQGLISGNADVRNLETLHGLLHSYNSRYKTRLRLTENFDVVNEEKIVETIDLDDDEESNSKKPRLDKEDDAKFDENLYRLRKLALRLRDLESKDKATASHRRALSKAIKTFNTSYNADIYLDDDNYEIIDRRCITLDSSSDSDCVVEEPRARSKKLRNPFNILKRRKERQQSLNNPGTSKDNNYSDPIEADPSSASADEDNNKYSGQIIETFNETWLPNETDFGRAEIVPKRSMNFRLEFSSKEQFLYEYMKDQFHQYKNWLEAKISFLRYLDEANIAFKSERARILADTELSNNGLKPLIDFEDSSDMPSVLEKLRIIENNKEIDTETSLRIDFDVYNRNVQNFRKRNPPKPHFRIICLDESSGVPSAAHVMSLHSKYEDNVPIVFAVVSTASISYIKMNPIDLPVYVPSNDVV